MSSAFSFDPSVAAGLEFWSFVEACDVARRPADVGAALDAAMAKLGITTHAVCSMVDLANPPPDAVILTNVSPAWFEHYKEQNYHRINPVHREALRRAGPFQWRDPEFRARLDLAQTRFMAEVDDLCGGDGVTFPLRSRHALPATCSFVEPCRAVPGPRLQFAHAIAVVAHDVVRRLQGAADGTAPLLTTRERQCLTLVARGKSDWTIGELLGVSEGAVHKTIERAKRRLGVATRVQAVLAAIHSGDISMAEALD